MKRLIYTLAMLLCTIGYSQINQRNTTPILDNGNIPNRNYQTNGVLNYSNGDKQVILIPDDKGYSVSSKINGTTSTIGKIRKTINNGGYYIIYSNGREPGYGKFDENGNFMAFRYDATRDMVVEDNYIKNMTQRNSRTRTNRNIEENMNSENGIETPSTRMREIPTLP